MFRSALRSMPLGLLITAALTGCTDDPSPGPTGPGPAPASARAVAERAEPEGPLPEEASHPPSAGASANKLARIDRVAFGRAMRAALLLGNGDVVKFRNHDFEVRPATVIRVKPGPGIPNPRPAVMYAGGVIYHRRTFWPDDKIVYKFTKTYGGPPENLEINFDSSKDTLRKWVEEIIKRIDDGKSPRVQSVYEPFPETEQILARHGGWKMEARFLIANLVPRL